MKTTIALGTTSKHKVHAAETAVARAGALYEVRPTKTASRVPEQPLGLDQTTEGALNRANAALAVVPDVGQVEVQVGAIRPGDRVLVVDDLLATGGTAGAAVALARRLGGEVLVIELEDPAGRARLADFNVPVHALLTY